MTSAISIAGEVAGAATAMAGLILVFLGATSTSFDSYQKQEQNSVRKRYRQRAWSAFTGLSLSLLATFFALVSKWADSEAMAVTAFILLVAGLVFVVAVAITTVLEIK
jgi:uncharacterized membrane protein